MLPETFWACWVCPGFSAAWTTSGPVAPNSPTVCLNSLWSSDDKSGTRKERSARFGVRNWRVATQGLGFSSCCLPHPFTPQTSPDSTMRLKWCHHPRPQCAWCSASFLKCAGPLPVWDALMCCRSRTPGWGLVEHENAACHSLPKGRRKESLPSWKEKRGFNIIAHLWGKQMQIGKVDLQASATVTGIHTGSAGDDSPLKYLPADQEAQCDGYSRPQVLCFGENLAIAVRQVSPTVAFRKPNPVRPYLLTKPRQHPEGWNRKIFRPFWYYMEGNQGFVCLVIFIQFPFKVYSNSLSCDKWSREKGNTEERVLIGGVKSHWASATGATSVHLFYVKRNDEEMSMSTLSGPWTQTAV